MSGNHGVAHSEECTLMFRNLSHKLAQEDVKRILDGVGLAGKFSFVYVPQIVVRRSNVGYAFVRFKKTEYAQECLRLCHGKPFGSAQSKPCRICFAKSQDGVDEILCKPRRKHGGRRPEILLCGDSDDEAPRRTAPSHSDVAGGSSATHGAAWAQGSRLGDEGSARQGATARAPAGHAPVDPWLSGVPSWPPMPPPPARPSAASGSAAQSSDMAGHDAERQALGSHKFSAGQHRLPLPAKLAAVPTDRPGPCGSSPTRSPGTAEWCGRLGSSDAVFQRARTAHVHHDGRLVLRGDGDSHGSADLGGVLQQYGMPADGLVISL